MAGNLEKLDDELKGVADKLGIWKLSASGSCGKTARDPEEMPVMQEGEINETAEELAKALGDLPNAESDERL